MKKIFFKLTFMFIEVMSFPSFNIWCIKSNEFIAKLTDQVLSKTPFSDYRWDQQKSFFHAQ